MMFRFVLIFLNLSPLYYQFLFPSSSSSSCGSCACPPAPICPAPQPCQPIVACPTQTCCNSCNSCKSKRAKREILSNATFVAEFDKIATRGREKRKTSTEANLCNSEELRTIIEQKIDRITAIAKRRIQDEAELKLNGRFNVICTRGDFSYLVSTELYCQHTVADVTCFVFKQLSDVVRMRLA
ncbi:unnamed protein product [Caenorhabditis bovis]|uniref:Ground-like domain-containing protein n=1 Tax=Caenorhabditis bovis TaxID=2654633 RepID=A0A8S1EBT4_9PELO|nr:unnamed protein product [Caenorhabditis bovis]